jgi:hypothetical protein
VVEIKGFAHIGVLKVLEEQAKIDYIGGTSMVPGALCHRMLLKSILFSWLPILMN